MTLYQFNVNIGDWSDDGHGKTDTFLFESNYPVDHLQKAYKKSVKTTGLELSDVCREYEEDKINEDDFAKLKKLGCSMDLMSPDADVGDYGGASPNPEGLAEIMMWFVGLSMPEDFTCKRMANDVANFNGYWGDLNLSFGYGLYY